MRMAFVTLGDARDVNLWAGTPHHMLAGFRANGIDVEMVGNLRRPGRIPLKSAEVLHNRIAQTVYRWDREPLLQASYARQISRRLKVLPPVDFILSPGTIPVSLLQVEDIPTVIWSDATIHNMLDYYPAFSQWSPRAIRNAISMEQAALDRCALFVGSSEWSTESAVLHYGIDRDRASTIMFGANLDRPPHTRTVNDPAREIHVLVVGVDWFRKGVDTAVAAVGHLRRAGIDVVLDVVGAQPPTDSVPEYVNIHGFVDKKTAAGRHKMDALFSRAALFLLPSLAECTAIVLCEAAAYGLPIIVPDTGGMRAVVRDGVNGRVLPVGSQPEVYSSEAARILTSPDLFHTYSRGSRSLFERELNWESSTKAVIDQISSL